MFFEVRLVGIEHAIEPRKELVGTVIGVQHYGDAVGLGDGANVVRTGNGPKNRCFLVRIREPFSGEIS